MSQVGFWKAIRDNYVPLQVDKVFDEGVRFKDMAYYRIVLTEDLTNKLLRDAAGAYHTEINDLLLCGLAITLSQWNGDNRVTIGLEGHGREEGIISGLDTSHTVGWFTILYPVGMRIEEEKGLGGVLKGVKEQLRRIPDRGIGYGVLKYMNGEESLSGEDPWDVVFNYLGQLDNVVRGSEWIGAAQESTGRHSGGENGAESRMVVNSMIVSGELVMNWSYSSRHYEVATIERLSGMYRRNLELLIAHCGEQGAKGVVYTPSDYGLGEEISVEELDNFLNEKGSGMGNIMEF
jgi:non-ribosomal peptide synthase protein (TIGR01720 family)